MDFVNYIFVMLTTVEHIVYSLS